MSETGRLLDDLAYAPIPLPPLTLHLPWPPSNNHYYTVGRGRKILSNKGRDYAVGAVVALGGRNRPVQPLEGRFRVEVRASPPDRRKRDLDNLLKPLLDALTKGGVICDDGAIDDLRIVRCAVVPGGAITVTLWLL